MDAKSELEVFRLEAENEARGLRAELAAARQALADLKVSKTRGSASSTGGRTPGGRTPHTPSEDISPASTDTYAAALRATRADLRLNYLEAQMMAKDQQMRAKDERITRLLETLTAMRNDPGAPRQRFDSESVDSIAHGALKEPWP